MAGPILLDRVKETTTSFGVLTTLTLVGAVTGFNGFYQPGLLDVGDWFHITIEHTNRGLAQWQTCQAELTDATTITVLEVYDSSRIDKGAVTFSEGAKYVWIDFDATLARQALEGGGIASIGLTLPAEFSVTNSPLTADGVIAADWASQAQNRVFASPNGSAGVPTFRALAAADIPDLSAIYSTPASVATQIAGATIAASQLSGDIAIARIATALTTPGPIGGTTPSTGRFTQVGIGIAPVVGDMLSITPAAIANIGIHITGLSGQTGSLGYFQNVDNTARMEITAAMGISSRLASASTGVVAGRVFGDTQPRINLNANGDFIWTDGINAEDLRLAREGAGIMSTTAVVAATAAVTTTHRLKVNLPGATAAAAGFGGGVLFQGKSSTTNSQSMGEIDWEWIVATHASRTSRVSIHGFNGATKQEGLRIDGDAGGVKIGLYAVAAVARQTVTGSRASGAALADLLTKLALTGIIIDGSSA